MLLNYCHGRRCGADPIRALFHPRVGRVASKHDMNHESATTRRVVSPSSLFSAQTQAMFGRASSALQGHEGGLFSSSRMYLQFDREGMVLVKNSYEEKDLLKAAGFRWNVENKCWTVMNPQIFEYFLPGKRFHVRREIPPV
jgi:hypothetical protein